MGGDKSVVHHNLESRHVSQKGPWGLSNPNYFTNEET